MAAIMNHRGAIARMKNRIMRKRFPVNLLGRGVECTCKIIMICLD